MDGLEPLAAAEVGGRGQGASVRPQDIAGGFSLQGRSTEFLDPMVYYFGWFRAVCFTYFGGPGCCRVGLGGRKVGLGVVVR